MMSIGGTRIWGVEEGGTRFNIDTTCNSFKYMYKLKNDNEDGGYQGTSIAVRRSCNGVLP